MVWDPQLYLKFGQERTQPAIDLVSRVQLANPRRIVDLGCGPGNSTAVLQSRWPGAAITGLDSDPEMLAAARESKARVSWIQKDASDWHAEGEFELVFSNALLQWLPDHETVISRWFDSVAPDGALAVQLPPHLNSAVHHHILEVAGNSRWNHLTRSARHAINAAAPEYYYDILCEFTSRIDLWVTEYCHVLDAPQKIVDWMRGTGLRPFLNALNTDEQRKAFELELLEHVTRSYPRRRDGKVLFPFRRLFFVAYR